MVRGAGRLVWIGIGYALAVGVLKSITVGAVARFVAEVVAWAVVVMLAMWVNGILAGSARRLPIDFELVFAFGLAALGVAFGRGLRLGARFESVSTERTFAVEVCNGMMMGTSMMLVQSMPDAARAIVTLVRQSPPEPGTSMWYLYLPAFLGIAIATYWWKRRLLQVDGPVFLLRWLRWMVSLAITMIVTGVMLSWLLSRNVNAAKWAGDVPGLLTTLPPLIAAISAMPAVRRAARDSDNVRSGRCRGCGYDMNALEDAATCPECGRPRRSQDAAG